MTAKELIEMLSDLSPDARVTVEVTVQYSDSWIEESRDIVSAEVLGKDRLELHLE